MENVEQRVSRSFETQGLMQTLGAKLALVGDGEVHVTLPFSKHLSQQHGFIHAGVVTSIVDNACGYAALTKAPQGCEIVSVEFKINFLRPALGDRFLAVGRVQNAGRSLTICTGEVRAFHGDETSFKVVAIMQATMMTVQQDII